MNLHGLVRGAITSVNPDIAGTFTASTGNTVDGAGNITPQYAAPLPVRFQVQPPGSKDLQHIERLNIQKICRVVFMFGNAQGVVRPNQQGGDLLTFPQFTGQAPATWLTVYADGPWSVEGGGWTKIIAVLQESPP